MLCRAGCCVLSCCWIPISTSELLVWYLKDCSVELLVVPDLPPLIGTAATPLVDEGGVLLISMGGGLLVVVCVCISVVKAVWFLLPLLSLLLLFPRLPVMLLLLLLLLLLRFLLLILSLSLLSVVATERIESGREFCEDVLEEEEDRLFGLVEWLLLNCI